MRKVLSTTAGATFHNETTYMTFCVRKDYIEMIFKVDRGVYIIINIAHVTPEKVVLFTNWGTYFDCLQNLPVQMPRIKATCPTLYAVLTGDDPDDVGEVEIGHPGDKGHGLGIFIDVPKNTPIMKCFSDKLLEAGRILCNKVMKVYHEIESNPPFPGWKTNLDELWN